VGRGGARLEEGMAALVGRRSQRAGASRHLAQCWGSGDAQEARGAGRGRRCPGGQGARRAGGVQEATKEKEGFWKSGSERRWALGGGWRLGAGSRQWMGIGERNE